MESNLDIIQQMENNKIMFTPKQRNKDQSIYITHLRPIIMYKFVKRREIKLSC